jgi:hypothetical protein
VAKDEPIEKQFKGRQLTDNFHDFLDAQSVLQFRCSTQYATNTLLAAQQAFH